MEDDGREESEAEEGVMYKPGMSVRGRGRGKIATQQSSDRKDNASNASQAAELGDGFWATVLDGSRRRGGEKMIKMQVLPGRSKEATVPIYGVRIRTAAAICLGHPCDTVDQGAERPLSADFGLAQFGGVEAISGHSPSAAVSPVSTRGCATDDFRLPRGPTGSTWDVAWLWAVAVKVNAN